MLKLYKYCFYRITRFWDHPVHYSLSYDPLTQKVDPTHLIYSMGIVSLLQISNLNTLLILPVVVLYIFASKKIIQAFAYRGVK